MNTYNEIASLVAPSHALSCWLRVNPQVLLTLSKRSRAELEKEWAHLLEGGAPIEEVASIFKYANMCRIVALERKGKLSGMDACEAWSDVTDIIIGGLYAHVAEGQQHRFCVVGLGKLGSKELNYSSDVDLLYIFDTEFDKSVELAKKLSALISSRTIGGFLYRLDLRLRPEGEKGPIATSLTFAEKYYGGKGRDWERMALVRSRHIAGDVGVWNEFSKIIKPFVYRRNIDAGSLSGIREIKNEIVSKDEANNIDLKFGPGGIRDIEFFVQSLQLIHGGANLKLQTVSTCAALKELGKLGVIKKDEVKDLQTAYETLRRAENAMQIRNETQVHTIPLFDDSSDYLREYLSDRTVIDNIMMLRKRAKLCFDNLLKDDIRKGALKESLETNIASARTIEERIDSLAWFKREEVRRIARLDLEGKMPPLDVMMELSMISELVVEKACEISSAELSKVYGRPMTNEGSAFAKEAGFAILGMGSISSCKMDYESDLDLIFLYSGAGETNGKAKIDNYIYFTKLVQRMLSMVSLPTRYGKAYSVDPELRPSGRSGVLVTSLDAFLEYQNSTAQFWERQSMIQARTICVTGSFPKDVEPKLKRIVYERELPEGVIEEMRTMRQKISDNKWQRGEGILDLKYSPGTIFDIKVLVFYLQLMNYVRNAALATCDPLHAIRELSGLMEEEDRDKLAEAFLFFKSTLCRVRLISSNKASTIDTSNEKFEYLLYTLGMGKKEFVDKFKDLSARVSVVVENTISEPAHRV